MNVRAVFVFAPIRDRVYEMCLYFNRYCFCFLLLLRFTKYQLCFICIRIGGKICLVWIVFVTILCVCVCVSTRICIKTYIVCIFDCICILGGWFHCMLHHLGWQAPWICIDCEGCILLPRVSQNYICFPQQRMQQAKSFCLLVLSFRSSLDVKIVYLCGGML